MALHPERNKLKIALAPGTSFVNAPGLSSSIHVFSRIPLPRQWVTLATALVTLALVAGSTGFTGRWWHWIHWLLVPLDSLVTGPAGSSSLSLHSRQPIPPTLLCCGHRHVTGHRPAWGTCIPSAGRARQAGAPEPLHVRCTFSGVDTVTRRTTAAVRYIESDTRHRSVHSVWWVRQRRQRPWWPQRESSIVKPGSTMRDSPGQHQWWPAH